MCSGVMTLRNRLLPLVSLRSMFGLDRRASDEASRIVVVAVQGASVGVVVDNVNEVLRVPQKLVEPMPPLLAREGDMADITEICSIDGGKRLVSIISTDNLFRHSAIKDALANLDVRLASVHRIVTAMPRTGRRAGAWCSAWEPKSSESRSTACRKSSACPPS